MTNPDGPRLILIIVPALSLLGNALTIGAALRLRQAEQTLFGPDAATHRLPPALRRQLATALSDHKADFRARARPTHQSPRRLHRHSPTL